MPQEKCDAVSSGSVVVAVRVRPLSTKEMQTKQSSTLVQDSATSLKLAGDAHAMNYAASAVSYSFNKVFWSLTDNVSEEAAEQGQKEVYEFLGPQLVANVLSGFNACLFAYGQTGSGKTYTMIGDNSNETILQNGVVPRLCLNLFDAIASENTAAEENDEAVTYHVECSFAEIYCEKVRDLLPSSKHPSPAAANLRVREDPKTGPYVEGLATHKVANAATVLALLQKGMAERATAETKLNERSSRSHAILQIRVTRVAVATSAVTAARTRSSKVSLVDLAGSERVNDSGAAGDRFEEARNINCSLHTLGRVIAALAERNPNPAIGPSTTTDAPTLPPYRDSVLTWLLSGSLGGNSKTFMIAAVSPSKCCLSQTLNTLRFAGMAQRVINVATVNEERDSLKEIAELKEQIAKLTAQLQRRQTRQVDADEVQRLKTTIGDLEESLVTSAQECDKLRTKWETFESSSLREERHKIRTLEANVAHLNSEIARLKKDHTVNVTELRAQMAEKTRTIVQQCGELKKKEAELTELMAKQRPSTPSSGDVSNQLEEERARHQVQVALLRGEIVQLNSRNQEMSFALQSEDAKRKAAESKLVAVQLDKDRLKFLEEEMDFKTEDANELTQLLFEESEESSRQTLYARAFREYAQLALKFSSAFCHEFSSFEARYALTHKQLESYWIIRMKEEALFACIIKEEACGRCNVVEQNSMSKLQNIQHQSAEILSNFEEALTHSKNQLHSAMRAAALEESRLKRQIAEISESRQSLKDTLEDEVADLKQQLADAELKSTTLRAANENEKRRLSEYIASLEESAADKIEENERLRVTVEHMKAEKKLLLSSVPRSVNDPSGDAAIAALADLGTNTPRSTHFLSPMATPSRPFRSPASCVDDTGGESPACIRPAAGATLTAGGTITPSRPIPIPENAWSGGSLGLSRAKAARDCAEQQRQSAAQLNEQLLAHVEDRSSLLDRVRLQLGEIRGPLFSTPLE